MRGRDGERTAARQIDQNRLRQRATFRRIGAAAHLINQDQRAIVRAFQDFTQVLQMRGERGQAGFD